MGRKPKPQSVPLYNTVSPNKRLHIHKMLQNKAENVKKIPETTARISASPSSQYRNQWVIIFFSIHFDDIVLLKCQFECVNLLPINVI